PARVGVDRASAPEDHPAIGLQDAEDDPHRGRLSGAVRADEADHPAGRGGERHAVEGDDVAEPAGDVDELEHGWPPPSPPPPGPAAAASRIMVAMQPGATRRCWRQM